MVMVIVSVIIVGSEKRGLHWLIDPATAAVADHKERRPGERVYRGGSV
jgi:hypothetical protein